MKLPIELTATSFQVTLLIISETAHWICSHVFSSIQILATDRLTKPEYHIITFNTTPTTSQLSPIRPSKSCNKLQHYKAYLHCRNPVGTTLLATSDRKINNKFKTWNTFCYRGTRWRSWLRHCAKSWKFWILFLMESLEYFIVINFPAGRLGL